MGCYGKSTNATIKAPTAINYETIYTHSSETNKVHRFTQKYSYTDISDIQNFLISLKKLLYTNYGIGDVVVGTTPVITLGEPLFYICRNCDDDSASSGRTYRTDNLYIITCVWRQKRAWLLHKVLIHISVLHGCFLFLRVVYKVLQPCK